MVQYSKRKVLNISKPPISSFFHIDIPLMILFDDKRTHNWIFNNYIQIYSLTSINEWCYIDFENIRYGHFRLLELTNCPWILFERISRKDVINKWENALNFVKEKINENKYIGITINKKYIKNYKCPENEFHNLFIYGYDDDRGVLLAADHFFNGILSFQEVSYDEFMESVKYSYDLDLNWGNLEGICVLSKIERTHENIYNIDICKMIHDLKEYIYYEELSYGCDGYFIYGINCYDNLIKYYENINKDGGNCDLKGIHVMISHKYMMFLRIKFLKENDIDILNLEELFNDIYVKLKIILSLLIKYNMTEKKHYILKAISQLNDIKEKDINASKSLLNILINHKKS